MKQTTADPNSRFSAPEDAVHESRLKPIEFRTAHRLPGTDASLCLFTVIIPTFNRHEKLRDCLSSLRNLKLETDRFEAIVVDDGSTYPVIEIVAAFKNHLNIQLIRTENQGPAAARNCAAQYARGRFLVFTDDDCQVCPDFLNLLEEQFKSSPDCILGGRTTNIASSNLYAATNQVIIDLVYAFYNRNVLEATFFASNNMAVPTESFRLIGGFNARFTVASEDREFCNRWIHSGYTMRYLSVPTVRHAHSKTFISFCKQHFNYGRGALQFHHVCKRRHSGKLVDHLKFHLDFIRHLPDYLSSQKHKKTLILAMLFVWQVCNAAGFLYELCLIPFRSRQPGLTPQVRLPHLLEDNE